MVRFNGQPIAIVVADTFERAVYAASLVKAQYQKEEHHTDLREKQRMQNHSKEILTKITYAEKLMHGRMHL